MTGNARNSGSDPISTHVVPPDQRDRQDAHRLKLGEGGPSGKNSTPSTLPADAAPSAPSPSPFNGTGIFTTNDASSASGHPCAWVAVQKDPEGDPAPTFNNNPAKLCYWQARPTLDVIETANERSIPYIAQAENQTEIAVALELGPKILVPKALVGKPDGWTNDQFMVAIHQGWRLIAEWYWNAQPSMVAPDAGSYPYFDNVCFGIYSEGEQGGEGYVEQKPLAEYLSVWRGPFSVWKAEAMTAADWLVFDRGAA